MSLQETGSSPQWCFPVLSRVSMVSVLPAAAGHVHAHGTASVNACVNTHCSSHLAPAHFLLHWLWHSSSVCIRLCVSSVLQMVRLALACSVLCVDMRQRQVAARGLYGWAGGCCTSLHPLLPAKGCVTALYALPWPPFASATLLGHVHRVIQHQCPLLPWCYQGGVSVDAAAS